MNEGLGLMFLGMIIGVVLASVINVAQYFYEKHPKDGLRCEANIFTKRICIYETTPGAWSAFLKERK